jgi:hypothetical protein
MPHRHTHTMHARTHTHTLPHSRTHAHTRTNTHTHANRHTRAGTHTHTHSIMTVSHTHRTHTCMHAHTHTRARSLTHTVAHTQGISVSICRSIYPSIHLAPIVSIHLLFHLSLRCCIDARLRCNTVCIAAAPRCDGMLRRARRHHTTAPASSSPSNPTAECSRVPPEYPAIEPPALRFALCARECGGACHTGAAARAGACRAEAHPPHVSTRRVPAEPRPLGSHGARGRHGST